MPSIFTPTPPGTEQKAPGIGGKPPVDRRPTGGGGVGETTTGRSRAEARESSLSHPGLCLLRSGRRHDVLCGAGHAVLCAPGRHPHGSPHPSPDRRLASGLLPPILFLNTAVLLLSSLTMEFARRPYLPRIRRAGGMARPGHPALRRTRPWVAATLVSGTSVSLSARPWPGSN